VVPVALAICLASSWIIKLYGINVSGGENALSIAAISAAIYGLSTPAINLIMAKSSIWLILGLNAAWAAAYTAIGLSSVHLGAQGVASALAISHFGHAVLLAIWTYRYFANPVRD
jgi:O-antigen/teichoic acid export membrane protein